jgi:hypothetical protein
VIAIFLVWCLAGKRHVRPMFVVPVKNCGQLTPHRNTPQWNYRQTTQKLLHRENIPLNYGNAPVLSHSAKARSDPTTPTPASVGGTWPELLTLVADEVSRWLAGLKNCPGEKASDRDGIRFAVEGSKAYDPS